jgi:hypothetical protein
MPLSAYPDLGLFVRAARILPVVAVAAFAGGVVGGFVVFAINGALAPPRPGLGTNNQAAAPAVPAKPVTIIGAPTPNPPVTPPPAAAAPPQNPIQAPSAATSVATAPLATTPVATTAQTGPQTASQTAPQDEPRATRWPNALMRGRKVITPLSPSVTPATGEGEAEKSAQSDHKSSGAASADNDRAAPRRHARAVKKRDKDFSSGTGARQAADRAYNRVYDYGGAGDSDASDRGVESPYFGAQHRRVIIRGQRPQWMRPAEAAPPWSGQFWGGGYYRDDR